MLSTLAHSRRRLLPHPLSVSQASAQMWVNPTYNRWYRMRPSALRCMQRYFSGVLICGSVPIDETEPMAFPSCSSSLCSIPGHPCLSHSFAVQLASWPENCSSRPAESLGLDTQGFVSSIWTIICLFTYGLPLSFLNKWGRHLNSNAGECFF